MIPAMQLLDASKNFYRIGGLVKSSSNAVKSFSLAGVLQASDSGWILLSVPNALVRGAFDAIHEPGVELPPNKSGKLNAHISVIRPEELESIGGLDRVTERGKQFHYTIDGLKTCEPSGWDEMSRVWYLAVKSPELENLRKSYGLSPRPKNNKFEFHITVAVRRKHVLRNNDVKKAESLPPLPDYFLAKESNNPLFEELPELPEGFKKEATPVDTGSNDRIRRLIMQLDVVDDLLYLRYRKNMAKLQQTAQATNRPDIYQQGIEALKAGKFDDFAKLLNSQGTSAQTGHKRLAISDRVLNEDTLGRLGFLKTKIAIPEEGQISSTNWRHPDTNLHFHPHNGFFTVHEDSHPALTMSVRKKDPNLFSALNSGIVHAATEGVPGAFYYLRNKIMNPPAPTVVDPSKLDSNSKPLSGIVSRIFNENPSSLIISPQEKLVPPTPTVKAAARKEEYVPSVVKLSLRSGEQKLCPRCGKQILHDLYTDRKGWKFHRSCFTKGEGRVKESFDSSLGGFNLVSTLRNLHEKGVSWDQRLAPLREKLKAGKQPTFSDAEKALDDYVSGGKEIAQTPVLGIPTGQIVGNIRNLQYLPQQAESLLMNSGLLDQSPERAKRINKGLFDKNWTYNHYMRYADPKTTDSWFKNHHIDRALRYGKENLFDKGLFKQRENSIIDRPDLGLEGKYQELLRINPTAAKAFKDAWLSPDGEVVKLVGNARTPSLPNKYYQAVGQYLPTAATALSLGSTALISSLTNNLLAGNKQAANYRYDLPAGKTPDPLLQHIGRMAVRLQEPAKVTLVDPNRPSAFEDTPSPVLSRNPVLKPKLLLDLQNPFTAAKARELYDKLYPHHLTRVAPNQ